MRKRYLLFLVIAVAALLCGCGNGESPRDSRSNDEQTENRREEQIAATERPTEEPAATEEPKPIHNFNLEKDAAFWYEYDAEGELAKVRPRGYLAKFIGSFAGISELNVLGQITDAEYAQDGHLVSLAAKAENFEGVSAGTAIYLEAQYSDGGRITNIKVTWHHSDYHFDDETANIMLTYNQSTGYIKAVCNEKFGTLNGMEAELDSSLNITYSKITNGKGAGWVGSKYSEYYSNDVVSKEVSYDKNSGEKGMEYAYYDNGQKSDYWYYDHATGKLEGHTQYDRSGNEIK